MRKSQIKGGKSNGFRFVHSRMSQCIKQRNVEFILFNVEDVGDAYKWICLVTLVGYSKSIFWNVPIQILQKFLGNAPIP